MYVFKPTLYCEASGCELVMEGDPGENAGSLRKKAKTDGWGFRRLPGMDKRGDVCNWCIQQTGAERDAFKRQAYNIHAEAQDLADEIRFLLTLLAGADLHRDDAIRIGVLRNRLSVRHPQDSR